MMLRQQNARSPKRQLLEWLRWKFDVRRRRWSESDRNSRGQASVFWVRIPLAPPTRPTRRFLWAISAAIRPCGPYADIQRPVWRDGGCIVHRRCPWLGRLAVCCM